MGGGGRHANPRCTEHSPAGATRNRLACPRYGDCIDQNGCGLFWDLLTGAALAWHEDRLWSSPWESRAAPSASYVAFRDLIAGAALPTANSA